MSQITINNHEVNVVEYKGQRVITFKMIDELHERPEGTAGRNFRENRERFVPGEDYIEVCADEIRRNKIVEISPKAHRDVTLLTSSGYAMLAKSLTDDLSWTIQRELVRSYFKPPVAIPKPKRTRKPAFDTAFTRCMNVVALLPNVDENQKLLMAARGTHTLCGINPLEVMGYTAIPAATQDNYLTPTELGRQVGLSGRRVNQILCEEAHLQVHTPGSSSGSDWSMTEKGLAFGKMFDSTRKGGKGSQQQLKWKPSAIEFLRPFANPPA